MCHRKDECVQFSYKSNLVFIDSLMFHNVGRLVFSGSSLK